MSVYYKLINKLTALYVISYFRCICTDITTDKGYCTENTTDKAYCTDNITDTGYCTYNTSDKSYYTDNTTDKSYCTDNTTDKGYCTDNTTDKGYCTDNTTDEGYCTDNTTDKGYCLFKIKVSISLNTFTGSHMYTLTKLINSMPNLQISKIETNSHFKTVLFYSILF